jgi:hypothetical protein
MFLCCRSLLTASIEITMRLKDIVAHLENAQPKLKRKHFRVKMSNVVVGKDGQICCILIPYIVKYDVEVLKSGVQNTVSVQP